MYNDHGHYNFWHGYCEILGDEADLLPGHKKSFWFGLSGATGAAQLDAAKPDSAQQVAAQVVPRARRLCKDLRSDDHNHHIRDKYQTFLYTNDIYANTIQRVHCDAEHFALVVDCILVEDYSPVVDCILVEGYSLPEADCISVVGYSLQAVVFQALVEVFYTFYNNYPDLLMDTS